MKVRVFFAMDPSGSTPFGLAENRVDTLYEARASGLDVLDGRR